MGIIGDWELCIKLYNTISFVQRGKNYKYYNLYKTIHISNNNGMDNKLWEYRTKRKLSLKELSRLTGISVSELNNIENGNTNDILLSNAITLSNVLKVDLYELFCIRKWIGGRWKLWKKNFIS